MQVQLVLVNNDNTSPGVQRISDRLGYIQIEQTDRQAESELTFHIVNNWWKKVLQTLQLGTIVDSEVDTDDGPIESNDRMKILNSLEEGGNIFYVTFVRRICSNEHPMLFSIYRGGQLTFSSKDLNHIKEIGPLLPV